MVGTLQPQVLTPFWGSTMCPKLDANAEEVGQHGVGIRPRGVAPSSLGGSFVDLVSISEEDGIHQGLCICHEGFDFSIPQIPVVNRRM